MYSYLKNKSLVVPLACGIVALVLYCLTLQHSIFLADSTEFINAVGTRGVAHPPGYPIFLVLARLIALVPFGSLALKMNFLAALLGSVAVGITAFIIERLTKSWIAACVGAGFLALSHAFWLYSLNSEVFTLHTLMIALVTLAALFFNTAPSNRRALVMVGVFAFNASNHHTAILLAPALAYLFWRHRKKLKFSFLFVVQLVVVSLAGFTPYLDIFIVARAHPVVNWDDVTNFKNFIHLLLRKDYGSFALAPTQTLYTTHATSFTLYIKNFFQEEFGLLATGTALGIYCAYRKKIRFAWFLIFGWLALGAGFALVSRVDIASILQSSAMIRFSIASNFFAAVLLGIGVSFLLEKIPAVAQKYSPALLAILTIPLFANYATSAQQHNFLYLDFSNELLRELPPHAIFLTTNDAQDFGTTYLRFVNHEREDIRVITFPKLFDGWYQTDVKKMYPELTDVIKPDAQETLRALCAKYGSQHTLFIGGLPSELGPVLDVCGAIPRGLMVELTTHDDALNYSPHYVDEQTAFFQNYIATLPTGPLDPRTEVVRYEIATHANDVGNYILSRDDARKAIAMFKLSTQVSPYFAQSFHQLAMIDEAVHDLDAAVSDERTAIAANPEYLWSYYNLGKDVLAQGNKADAKRYLTEFLSFKPSSQFEEYKGARKLLQGL